MKSLLASIFLVVPFATPAVAQPAEPVGAERIVSVGRDVTEIVFALGLGDQVVGVDDGSTYPTAAAERPRVGYVRTLSAEGIVSLDPTVVFAAGLAGPAVVFEQLASAGVQVVVVPDGYSVEAACSKVRVIAEALDRMEAGALLSEQMETRCERVSEVTVELEDRPRVLFLYARDSNALFVSGAATAADAMIRLAGGANAVSGFTGYKPLTAEAAVAAEPDVVLVPAGTLALIGGAEILAGHAALKLTPAGRAGAIVAMDDGALLGFGPRLGDAVADLASCLHPELADALADGDARTGSRARADTADHEPAGVGGTR